MPKPATGSLAVIPDTPGLVRFDPESFAKELQTGTARRVVPLQQGEGFKDAKLLGRGDPVESNDVFDGNSRILETWALDVGVPGLIVEIISSAQLTRRLPLLVGHTISIMRGPKKSIGGMKQVTDFGIVDKGVFDQELKDTFAAQYASELKEKKMREAEKLAARRRQAAQEQQK